MLQENEDEWKILKSKFKSQKGKEYEILYLKGNTYALHQSDNLKDKYKAYWDSKAKMWYFYVDNNDVQGTIDTKIKPLISRINEFYKISLQLDDLIAQLGDYVPKENDSDETIATKEETNQIKQRLLDFKKELLDVFSDDNFKERIAALIDFKAAQGYPYSLANVMLIKMQKPNATIVNSAKDWASAYNRTVNKNAKPIFVWRPAQSTGGFRKISKDDESQFYREIGKSKGDVLTPYEKMLFKKKSLSTNNSSKTFFELVGHYDVSDTTQMADKEDFIQKAKDAAPFAGEKKVMGGEDQDTISSEITPVYNGLLRYAESQNISINQANSGQGTNITIPKNDGNDIRITKLLAESILNELLHKSYLKDKGGFASKFHVGGNSGSNIKQQSEVASWMFMYAFGVDFKTAPINSEAIWGSDEKDMIKVLDTVTKAVNHLVDFVNVEISKTLNEINDMTTKGKNITSMDIAKVLGIIPQYRNALNNVNTVEEPDNMDDKSINEISRMKSLMGYKPGVTNAVKSSINEYNGKEIVFENARPLEKLLLMAENKLYK